jgi:hypothetical protein
VGGSDSPSLGLASPSSEVSWAPLKEEVRRLWAVLRSLSEGPESCLSQAKGHLCWPLSAWHILVQHVFSWGGWQELSWVSGNMSAWDPGSRYEPSVHLHPKALALCPRCPPLCSCSSAQLSHLIPPRHVHTLRPHPSSTPPQPGRQGLAHKLPQAVDQGVNHGRLGLPHAVHGQSSGHCIQGYHFAPSDACKVRPSLVSGGKPTKTQAPVQRGPRAPQVR